MGLQNLFTEVKKLYPLLRCEVWKLRPVAKDRKMYTGSQWSTLLHLPQLTSFICNKLASINVQRNLFFGILILFNCIVILGYLLAKFWPEI